MITQYNDTCPIDDPHCEGSGQCTHKGELCPNSADGKHMIANSWGSMRPYGYCGVCNFCLATFTPRTAVIAYQNNHVLSIDLIKLLVALSGAQIEGYWLCQSCQRAYSDSVDRVRHFKEAHGL